MIYIADAIANMIADSYGFTERFKEIPANRYESRKDAFYDFLENINWKIFLNNSISKYFRDKFPVKYKNVDFDEIRVLEREFKEDICRLSVHLKKKDESDRWSMDYPYIKIYYKNRIILEFFVESPRQLDTKICEIANFIPEFKSEVRALKLNQLVW